MTKVIENPKVFYSVIGFTNPTLDEINFSEVETQIKNTQQHYQVKFLRLQELKAKRKITTSVESMKTITEEIRNLKSQLPCFCLSKFKDNYRRNENFLKSPGMILDFDSVADVQELKRKIENESRVFCCFISPSGDGLKVILLFDEPITNADQYKKVYKHYANEFSKLYGVEADNTADPARACLISYDPEIYVNEDCERISADVRVYTESNEVKKFSNEPILERFVGVEEGKRNTTLTKLIGVCIQKAIQEDVALVIAKEWNKTNLPPLEDDEVENTVKHLYKKYQDEINLFLDYTDNQKLSFNIYQFMKFLERLGYYKYRLGKGYVIVREENGILDLVTEEMIKEDVITRIADEVKKRYLIEKENSIFSEGKFDFLSPFEKPLNEDTKDTCVIYFSNGFIEVTKNLISELKPWEKLPKPIWKSKILKRKFISIEKKEEILNCVFGRFLKNISGNDENRFLSIVTAIGYSCHSFFDPSIRCVIVYYDETPPEMEGEAEGGKGKSLIGQALRHFVPNCAWIGGASLKQISSFTFQCVNPDTQLICIDDLVGQFDFSTMFAAVTEGLTVEKKYQDSFVVKNVKFIVTSNFTLAGDGISYARRLFEIEIAPHYNLDRRPIDDFGHRLFDDWDDLEWSRFDNFMLWCIKEYLEKGLVPYDKINVAKKKLIEKTGSEFYEYCKSIRVGIEYVTKHEYYRFINEFNEGIPKVKQAKFTLWLKKYAQVMGYEYIEVRGTGNRNNGFKLILKLKPLGGIILKKRS